MKNNEENSIENSEKDILSLNEEKIDLEKVIDKIPDEEPNEEPYEESNEIMEIDSKELIEQTSNEESIETINDNSFNNDQIKVYEEELNSIKFLTDPIRYNSTIYQGIQILLEKVSRIEEKLNESKK